MSDNIDASTFKNRVGTTLSKTNSALTVDFCPWANRYVYWLKNPVWVIVLAVIGSILCGLMVNPLVFVLTGVLVLLLLIGVVLPWYAVRGIDCSILFDVPRTQVGKPAIVRLKVTNRWPIPVWGLSLIRGFAENATQDGDEGVSLARVPGWSTVEYSWSFTPRRRGQYPCAEAEVETGFPFGLYHAHRKASVDGHLIVWPHTVRLNGVPDCFDTSQSEDQLCDRRVGDRGDMTGTRPFRNGDSLRRVHWSQTARLQTLIVTEGQAPAASTVRVTVDTSTFAHQNETADVTLERCIQTAASLCESLHSQHTRVELVIGKQVIVAGEAVAGYQQIMDTLAVAQLSADQPRSSRRQSIDIRVTTAQGQLPDHPRQIVIDADQGSGSVWIHMSAVDDLKTQLPELWRRVSCVS